MRQILEKQRERCSRGETGVEADANSISLSVGPLKTRPEKLVSGLMEVLSHSREESLQTLDRGRLL